MPRLRLLLALSAALAVSTGCSAPAAAPPAATTTAAPAPAAGTVLLTGALRTPGSLTKEQLAALPPTTVQVSFGSSKGQEKHIETGVALSAVLPASALATTSAKNDQLAFAVLAVGADGYAATVSYGEISPDFGNRGVLVALSQDGKPLDRPRLVVPGDVKGGRDVSDLVELHVVRLARTGA